MKKVMIFFLCAILLLSIPPALCESGIEESIYVRAFTLLIQGEIDKAAVFFEDLGQYKDSAEHARYCHALLAGEEGDFDKAIEFFSALDSLYDSKEYVNYYKGRIQEANGNFREALALYLTAPYILDSKERINAIRNSSLSPVQTASFSLAPTPTLNPAPIPAPTDPPAPKPVATAPRKEPQPKVSIPLLKFVTTTFKPGQMLEVYDGPGNHYRRGANGKAAMSTNAAFYAVGWENNYLMVMYRVNNGGYRVGFISRARFKDTVDLPDLNLAYVETRVQTKGQVTEDPALLQTTIATLNPGMKVTLLARHNRPNTNWDYIEFTSNGQLMRGFVQEGVLTPQFEEDADIIR